IGQKMWPLECQRTNVNGWTDDGQRPVTKAHLSNQKQTQQCQLSSNVPTHITADKPQFQHVVGPHSGVAVSLKPPIHTWST
ncbi:hypothetical protein DPMN_169933, partial [Dreissena polymorpha]